MKFEEGDRVVMVRGDEWANPGQTGVVVDVGHVDAGGEYTVCVVWDGPKDFGLWHRAWLLDYEIGCSDPNLLFKRKQYIKSTGGKS